MDEETLRAITDSYQEGKRDGAAQERREIIRKLRHHLRSRANDDSPYINGVLDALEIIEERSQQPPKDMSRAMMGRKW